MATNLGRRGRRGARRPLIGKSKRPDSAGDADGLTQATPPEAISAHCGACRARGANGRARGRRVRNAPASRPGAVRRREYGSERERSISGGWQSSPRSSGSERGGRHRAGTTAILAMLSPPRGTASRSSPQRPRSDLRAVGVAMAIPTGRRARQAGGRTGAAAFCQRPCARGRNGAGGDLLDHPYPRPIRRSGAEYRGTRHSSSRCKSRLDGPRTLQPRPPAQAGSPSRRRDPRRFSSSCCLHARKLRQLACPCLATAFVRFLSWT